MSTSQSFFPKDVKRHAIGGTKLVTRLVGEMYPNHELTLPEFPENLPIGKMVWLVEDCPVVFSRLDLQFNSEDQFRHDIRKAIDGSN